jgi:hypothetical protein
MKADLNPSAYDAFAPFYDAFTAASDYFDIVTCFEDSLNYLSGEDELAAACAGMAPNLSDNQISAPATRPRPGAWHRRWSFGASPRYLPSRTSMTGGCDRARIGGGARGAR